MTVKLKTDQKIRISGSEELANVMQQVLLRENKFSRRKEHFWIVCLNNQLQVLMIELISLGSVNRVHIAPMDVFSFALQKNATKIVMVHNHPGGSLVPSALDKQLTDTMQAIGKFLKLPVLDHLIIAENGYYSFNDTGLLKKIEEESIFDLSFSKIENLHEDIKVLEKRIKSSEQDTIKKLARRIIDTNKYTVEEISKLTGLPKEEIEKMQKRRGK